MKRAVLLGNPSVGKSIIFNALTGLGVEVSNYPGTTVSVMSGAVKYEGEEFLVTDLPGVYSLSGDSAEERMVREYLVSENPDLYIVVLNAAHLERNLYLLLQVADLKKPLLVILNMMDDAAKAGKIINAKKISEIFGVPVVETVATEGKNLDIVAKYIVSGCTGTLAGVECCVFESCAAGKCGGAVCNTLKHNKSTIEQNENTSSQNETDLSHSLPDSKPATRFDEHIEAAKNSLQKYYNLTDGEALFALEGVRVSTLSPEVIETADILSEEIEKLHAMSPSQIIGTNRHNTASEIAAEVTSDAPKKKRVDFDSLLTRAFPGIPILIITMVAILMVVFVVGGFLETTIVSLMTTYIAEPFHALALPEIVDAIGGAVILALMSGLGIAFPYVFLFYIFISILEDTGYLTRAAFLADRFMHRLGLHGQGMIPLVLSFGCSVPAVMSTRLLPTKRERFIASVLVTMLPCSARTVVISGVVASFIGFGAALSIYAIVFVLVFVIGCILSKVTPGEQFGMILEMAEIRRPIPKYVFKKAWMRLKEFLYIAMPLLLVSSIFLGLFEYFGWVAMFESFIEPFSTAVLGIPGFAFTALMFGILRKEMAFETLAVMGGTADLITILSAPQLYIFALVCVLFVPCISTIAVLGKELGAKITVLVSLATVMIGIGLGALFNFGFMLL